MKKIIIVLLLLSIPAIYIFFQNTSAPSTPEPDYSVTTEPTVQQKTIDGYRYNIIITTPEKLHLFENKNNETVASLVEKNKCTAAINGGYYTSDGSPLGFFIDSNGASYPQHKSTLLNGFFSINEEPVIASSPPSTARIALQSGPILLQDGTVIPLQIKNDERDRRSLVGITERNEIMLLHIYGNENIFDGPLLAELPAVVQKIATAENLSLLSALALDGGGAAAFYSEDTSRSELERVGSILCVTR